MFSFINILTHFTSKGHYKYETRTNGNGKYTCHLYLWNKYEEFFFSNGYMSSKKNRLKWRNSIRFHTNARCHHNILGKERTRKKKHIQERKMENRNLLCVVAKSHVDYFILSLFCIQLIFSSTFQNFQQCFPRFPSKIDEKVNFRRRKFFFLILKKNLRDFIGLWSQFSVLSSEGQKLLPFPSKCFNFWYFYYRFYLISSQIFNKLMNFCPTKKRQINKIEFPLFLRLRCTPLLDEFFALLLRQRYKKY